MSVVTVRNLFCDCELASGPCPAVFYGQDGTASLIRRMARQAGWTTHRWSGRTLDKCSDCTREGR